MTGVVIHYTAGGSAHGSVSWMCSPASMGSSHFVVGRSGDVVQLVSLTREAWHAGISEMQCGDEMRGDANRFTIGIELANHGYLHAIDGVFYYELGRSLKRYRRLQPLYRDLCYSNGLVVKGWWEPYPDKQIYALAHLLNEIRSAGYSDAVENLVGHEEIAMPYGRKLDPGPMFPWNRFHRRITRRSVTYRSYPGIE